MAESKVHEYGFVRLVDTMPRENLDAAVVQAARVSYGEGTKTKSTDEGLIRYLLRHYHTTPFEMVDFKFHLKMPIFVARQWLRHRTASVNEMSARYSIVPETYFVPEEYRIQSQVNKQCSVEDAPKPGGNDRYVQKTIELSKVAWDHYDLMVENGVCRELARCHLPQSAYTEFYWKINMHNLLHFLQLRMDHGAQPEIREYANAIFLIIKDLVPLTAKAFEDYRMNSMSLSGPEIEAINNKDISLIKNKREQLEFLEKIKKLGISI